MDQKKPVGVLARVRNYAQAGMIAFSMAIAYAVPAHAAATTLHGTATLDTGAALNKAVVMAVDSTGVITQDTTSATGKFSIKVNSANKPYLLMTVPTDASTPLFGLAFTTGKANVDVFTDLILNMIYAAQGTDPTTQFATVPPLAPLQDQYNLVATMLQTSIQTWLVTNKIKLSKFSFITSPFTPGTKKKLGHVLSLTLIKTAFASGSEELEINDGVTDQDLTFTAGSVNHTVTDTSVTTVNSTATTIQQNSVVPVGGQQAGEIAALNSLLQQLQTVVNQKKSKLQVSDLNVFFDVIGYLNDGEDDADVSAVVPNAGNVAAADLVTQLRGVKMSNIGIAKIYPIIQDPNDPNSDDIAVVYSYDLPNGGFNSTTEGFKCAHDGSSCSFFGDQQIAQTIPGVSVVNLTTSDMNNADNNFRVIDAAIFAPTNTIDNSPGNQPTVSGPNGTTYFVQSGAPNQTGILPLLQAAVTRTLSPGGGVSDFQFVQDAFAIETGPLAPFPSAGDKFNFDVTPALGGNCPDGSTPPCVYASVINGVSAEPIHLVSPSLNGSPDHTIGSAPLGKSFKITWNLPQSSAVSNIALNGFVSNGACTETDTLNPTKAVSTTSTTGTIKFPTLTKVGGEAVVSASFSLVISNINGAKSKLVYVWGHGC